MHFIVSVKLVFHSVFQYVSRLAVQRPAESLQRRKPHSLGLVIFQDGQICRRDADLLGQLARALWRRAIITSRLTTMGIVPPP